MDAVHRDESMGENPAMSDPDVEHAREALAKLEHLVVQDIFLTETAKHADVVLPGASDWPEKDGNRLRHQPASADRPGGATLARQCAARDLLMICTISANGARSGSASSRSTLRSAS
jgi:hypothetical protein